MSLYFNPKAVITDPAQVTAMNSQLKYLAEMRGMGAADAKKLAVAMNVGRTPGDLFRAFDRNETLERVPNGHLATLSRAMQKSVSVHVGKTSFEFARASRVGAAKSSIHGAHGTVVDHGQRSYDGTVIPIHDIGYGIPFREMASAQSEGYDALYAEAVGAERTLLERLDTYMFDGDASLKVGDRVWLGLRNDPNVASAVLAFDLTLAGTSNDNIRNEIKRLVDILRITNDVSQDVEVAVSREIMSRLDTPWNAGNSSNVTLLDMVLKIRGVAGVYEDARLVGNQVAVLFFDSIDGFHPVTGMAISSYAEPRLRPRDPHDFVKWCAVGFLSRSTYSGKKCALYAE